MNEELEIETDDKEEKHMVDSYEGTISLNMHFHFQHLSKSAKDFVISKSEEDGIAPEEYLKDVLLNMAEELVDDLGLKDNEDEFSTYATVVKVEE